MRVYVLGRLNEYENAVVLSGFRHADILWDNTSHEFRRLFFGSPFEKIYNGVPFSPCEPYADGVMRPIEIGNELADRVREEFLNTLDNEGGGLYPIGVLLNAKTFLEDLARKDKAEAEDHKKLRDVNIRQIDEAIHMLSVALEGMDAVTRCGAG